MKILVLYEELAGYFVNCLNVMAAEKECEILLITKKDNSIAPFRFDFIHPSIRRFNREELSAQELGAMCAEFAPDLVFVCGWAYKPYLSLLKKISYKSSVLGFDNHWTGSYRQIAASLYFRTLVKSKLHYAYVPGTPQSEFAKRIGFKTNRILTGAYCADHSYYQKLYSEFYAEKKKNFPKVFLYVGRYVKEKGLEDLWNAFTEMQDENPSDWQLWCVGKGPLEPIRHNKIKHLGFLQQDEMASVIKQSGVFVLPSLFEPWGVVVHEFAAAGFPMICSDAVGAREAFVQHDSNGYIFNAGNKDQLKEMMLKFTKMSNEELEKMSSSSSSLSSRITPVNWVNKLLNTLKSEGN